MRNILTAYFLSALVPVGAALADDDCFAPRSQWQSREAAMHEAKNKGWTVRELDIDDGCYEIEGRDSQDRAIEVKLDPATLQVVEMEYEDDHARKDGNNPAAADTLPPPQNGLFGDGQPPKVKVN